MSQGTEDDTQRGAADGDCHVESSSTTLLANVRLYLCTFVDTNSHALTSIQFSFLPNNGNPTCPPRLGISR